jgi:hypothetical protein
MVGVKSKITNRHKALVSPACNRLLGAAAGGADPVADTGLTDAGALGANSPG